MNKEWVDYRIEFLSAKLGPFRVNPTEFYFEPTEEVYERLASGEESDIQSVASEIGKHLAINNTPFVTYEWGLKMELEVAGQINTNTGVIRIPFYFVGRKYALGTILAHEMTHSFLYSRGIRLDDVKLNEMFTDLAGVFVGLGKLYLNGIISDSNDCSTESITLCYLPPWLIGYCYNRVNELRSINAETSLRNLLPQAKRLINNS
jgi:hypothetical protein